MPLIRPAIMGVPASRAYPALVRATPGRVLYWQGLRPPAYATAGNYAMPAGAFSMEIWVKWTSLVGNRGILSCWGSNTGSLLAASATDTSIAFTVNAAEMRSGIMPVAGSWHHVVGTYDGTSRCLYVDGSLSSGPTSGITPTLAATPLVLGNYVGSSQPDILASLADAAIYSRALTAREVLAHYVAGLR